MSQMGIALDEAQAAAFARYYEMLVETNKVMNLTAITEPEEVLVKHFADSVSPGAGFGQKGAADPGRSGANEQLVFPSPEDASLLDIGTGAGFPAIPLKIAFPSLQVTMIDSLGKRVGFLERVIAELGLSGIRAFHGRAEDLARDAGHRESYDYVVSRAVAHMSVLAEYCLPYVRCGGYFIAYKSQEFLNGTEREESANAVGLLGGTIEEVRQICLPDSDAQRCLVFIKKEKPCPKKYPRKAGLPSKEPL